VKNLVGPNGEDAVATQTRHSFVPQTPENFTYDADGNLTQDGRWTYAWDAENRLVAMETLPSVASAFSVLKQKLEFVYDAQGRRVDKKVSTWSGSQWSVVSDSRFLYDGWNLLAEFSVDPSTLTFTLTRSYTWGLDLSGSAQGAGGVGGLLAINAGAATYATAYDGNGNLMGLANAADGTLAAEYEYDPFGNVIKSTGPAANACPFGFSTKYTDSETGLAYYGLRYYNPTQGRWLSRDPSEEQGGANLYGFVGNDPQDSVDYFGLFGDGQRANGGKTETFVTIEVGLSSKSLVHSYRTIRVPITKGHSDFYGYTEEESGESGGFDYVQEDHGLTNPYLQPERHFRKPSATEAEVDAAIKACSKEEFQRAMHRRQDGYSHYDKDYRWDPLHGEFGHAFTLKAPQGMHFPGTLPDEDMVAWGQANEHTKTKVAEWKKNCQCGKKQH